MSGGVSVFCWLDAPVAMFNGNLQNLVIRSKSVIKSSSVKRSQTGVISDQLRKSLYMVMCHVSLYMSLYMVICHVSLYMVIPHQGC